MAGLTRPANPPPLVSSTIHGKEDKDIKEGDSDVFNNMWTQMESAGARLVSKEKDLKVAGPNPPPLVSKATVPVSKETFTIHRSGIVFRDPSPRRPRPRPRPFSMF